MANFITASTTDKIPVYLGSDVFVGYVVVSVNFEKYLRDNVNNTSYYRITITSVKPDYDGKDKYETLAPTYKTREEIVQAAMDTNYCYVVGCANQLDANSYVYTTPLARGADRTDGVFRLENGAKSVVVKENNVLEFKAVDGDFPASSPAYSDNLEAVVLFFTLHNPYNRIYGISLYAKTAPQSADYQEIDNTTPPPVNPNPPDNPDQQPPTKPKVWDFPFAKRNEYGIIEATLSGEYEGITFTVNSGESITWDNKLEPMFLIYGSSFATEITAIDKDGISKTRKLDSSDVNRPSDDPFVFDDKNFLPDTEDTPPNWTNPFVDDWPAITFFHQQRLGFASSIKRPVTVWMSQPQAFECFATKTPPTAEDMIEATIASQQVNRINWASTDKGRLALGLDNAEWVLTGIDSEVCSPLSLKFTRYTEHGSAPYHKAIMTDAGLVHIKKDGQTVRTYSYTFSNDEYQSSDLTILARHLLADNPITSWAWQQEPLSTFYIATSQKNLLLNLTFLKEHDVVAWSAQIMNGEISSVINLLDDIYFIMKRRKANGAIVNTLEKVAPYFVLNGEVKSDKAFAIHLDSASLKGV